MDILSNILDNYPEEGYEKADGFDAAIIGVTSKGRLVYSMYKMIEILISRNNWTAKDATDYFFYSIESSHNGDKSPIFINLIN